MQVAPLRTQESLPSGQMGGRPGFLSPQQELLFLKGLLQEGGKTSSSFWPTSSPCDLEPRWQVQHPSRARAAGQQRLLRKPCGLSPGLSAPRPSHASCWPCTGAWSCWRSRGLGIRELGEGPGGGAEPWNGPGGWLSVAEGGQDPAGFLVSQRAFCACLYPWDPLVGAARPL